MAGRVGDEWLRLVKECLHRPWNAVDSIVSWFVWESSFLELFLL